MQIQKLILMFMLMTSFAYADDEESCMDKAQELAVGLKMTEHFLYMVENLNNGKETIDSACAKPWRTKYWEADFKKFNEPLIDARVGLEERGVTSTNNFSLLRRKRNEQVKMPGVCEMVEKHLKTNNRCLEPETYMRTLITKEIFRKSFEENCKKYLPAVQSNVAACAGTSR
jgi:hypothetical protein